MASAAAVYVPGAVFTLSQGELRRVRLQRAHRRQTCSRSPTSSPLEWTAPGQPGTIVVTHSRIADGDDRHWDVTRSFYRAAETRFDFVRSERALRVEVGPEAKRRWPEVRGDPFLRCPDACELAVQPGTTSKVACDSIHAPRRRSCHRACSGLKSHSSTWTRGEVWPHGIPSQACSRTTIPPSIPPAKRGTSSSITAAGSVVPAGDELDDDALVSVRVVLQPGRIRVVAPEHANPLSRSERAADVQRLGLTQRVQPVLARRRSRSLPRGVARRRRGRRAHATCRPENSRTHGATPFGDSGRAAPPSDPSILAERRLVLLSPDRVHIARPVQWRAWSLLL